MKRSLLATSLALIFPAQLAFADSSDTPTQLPPIVINASRNDATLAETEDFKLVVASTDKIYAAFFSW